MSFRVTKSTIFPLTVVTSLIASYFEWQTFNCLKKEASSAGEVEVNCLSSKDCTTSALEESSGFMEMPSCSLLHGLGMIAEAATFVMIGLYLGQWAVYNNYEIHPTDITFADVIGAASIATAPSFSDSFESEDFSDIG